MVNTNAGNIVQIKDHSAFSRRLSPARTSRLLEECRDIAMERLAKSTARALDNTDDALFKLADKAETTALQERYFDAMREIRIKRRDIESIFKKFIIEAADKTIHAPSAQQQTTPPAPNPIAESGFCLVENDDLEETLAISSLQEKIESLCHAELSALNSRIARLLGKTEATLADSPFSPSIICQAFKEACRNTQIGVDIKIILFKLFDRYICESINTIYNDINTHMSANGILPKLADKQKGESSPNKGQAASSGDGDFLSAFAQLVTANRPQLHSAMQAGTAIAGAANILNNLTLMQRGQWDAMGMGPSAINSATLMDTANNVVRIIKDNPITGNLGDNNVVIEVVALLFDYIFENETIPDRAKALIGRLQIPVLKVAILDPSFFSKRHHPARRLLNTLAHTTITLHNEESELYDGLEECIQKVLAEFETDIRVFETALRALDSFLEDFRAAADGDCEEDNQEALKAQQGRERLKTAQALATDEIEKRFSGKQAPEFIWNFSTEEWKNLLIVAHLNQGQDSDAWKNRLKMLDLLIWSVMPKETPEEKQKLSEITPNLISGLLMGMKLLAMKESEQETFLENLALCHARLLKTPDEEVTGPDQNPAAQVPTESASNTEIHSEEIATSPSSISADKDGDNSRPVMNQQTSPKSVLEKKPIIQEEALPLLTSRVFPAPRIIPASIAILEKKADTAQPALNTGVGIANTQSLRVEQLTTLDGSDQTDSDVDNDSSPRLQARIDPFGENSTPLDKSDNYSTQGSIVEDEYSELVRNLVPGIWITFKSENGVRTTERLSWISTVLDNFLFTSNESMKTRELSAKALVSALRSGKAMLADDLGVLVDNSMICMVENNAK